MDLLIATSNPHKLDEFRGILAPLGLRVRSLADVSHGAPVPEPDETGRTFEANARLKALAYASMFGVACLADDSGLEVDALAGEPGVDSAYYAGKDGPRAQRDARNNAKLLATLKGVPDERRTARYVCCICVASADGRVLHEARGTFDGRIGHEPRGTNGFGYDPLFLTDDGRTVAELSEHEKNARSHRAAASRDIVAKLRSTLAS